jgi:hypothetical protein
MSYRVLWATYAEERLELILRDASNPFELARRVTEIDRRLAARASRLGESRFDSTRIAFVRPFGLFFDVLDDVQTVIVYDVWRMDR